MKKITFVALWLVFHGMLVAQQKVSVKLTDAKTMTEMPLGHVRNLRTNLGVTSNENGVFQIEGLPTDSITISSTGYITQTVIFSALEQNKEIMMEHSVQQIAGIEVVGNKPTVMSLDKMAMKNLDAPITSNSISSQIMEQRNVSELGDAVKNATGVRPINRYGGFQTFRIRGFNNFVLLVDGVRDERHNLSTSAPSTNLANIKRIEVLKGPASVLFGHSALGGVINLVQKKPTDIQTGEFKASSGSFNTYNMSGGIGGPITDKLKYRADFGMTRTNGWRDFGVSTNNASVAFDYSPTLKDKIELSFQANNDLYDTDTGIPVDEDGSVVKDMDLETRYNDPQDYLKHKRKDTRVKYTRTFNDKLKITEHLSYSDDDIDYLSTEYLAFNASKDSLIRDFPFYFNHTTKTLQNQIDVTYKFTTSFVEHTSVIGHSISILDRKTFRGNVIGEGTYTTIAVKNPTLNQGHIEAVDTKVQVREEVVNGFYLHDWMKLSDKVKLLIGVRYDIFSGTYYTDQIDSDRNVTAPGHKTDIPSTAFTYRTGLVYQPTKTVSVFGSYSNYFKPSRTIGVNNEIFDPEKGLQAETGVKFEKENKANITLSAFYLRKNNIVEKYTTNKYHQIGEADSKGIELDVDMTLAEGLHLKAGYAYVDAKIREYNTDSLQVITAGNKLKYAPEHMANAWLMYEVPKGPVKGLGLGMGMNYVGENYTNSSNTYQLPAYTTMDALVSYRTKNIRVACNLNNLSNKHYFTDAIYQNQFFPGKERNVIISFAYRF